MLLTPRHLPERFLTLPLEHADTPRHADIIRNDVTLDSFMPPCLMLADYCDTAAPRRQRDMLHDMLLLDMMPRGLRCCHAAIADTPFTPFDVAAAMSFSIMPLLFRRLRRRRARLIDA